MKKKYIILVIKLLQILNIYFSFKLVVEMVSLGQSHYRVNWTQRQ